MEKIINEGSVYLIDIPAVPKLTAKGEHYVICPICTPGRDYKHRKEAKLGINMRKTPKPWRCNVCGAAGYVIDEAYLANAKIKPIMNIPRSLLLSEDILKWFDNTRKIRASTLNHFKIRMSQETILQIKSKDESKKGEYITRKCVNFPYFKNGMLVNVKYRDNDKNFKMIKDATKIMYNLDSMVDQDYVIITEGEFDAMAYHQAGLISVVSVPNGATITKKEKEHFEEHGVMDIQSNINLEYLDKCIDLFKDIETIYIATDSDPAGIKLREELARRLGKERCRWIRFDEYIYDQTDEETYYCKDANDVLLVHGEKVLSDSIHKAIPYPVEGVHSAKDFLVEMLVEFDDGKKKGQTTGYKSLDAHFNWYRGWPVVLNGYPGEGKSSFLFNLICISTILYKWKWGLYCPENYPPKNIADTMAEILVGNTSDKEFGGRMQRQEYESAVRDHLGEYIFFLDDEKGFTPEQLRKKKRKMVKQHGIVGFLTDPWKNLKHDYKGQRDDQYLGFQLGEEVRLTTKYNIINLIAHHPPNPVLDKNKVVTAPTAFNLTGGSVWFQTLYQILSIHKHQRDDWSDTIAELHVQKVKEHKLAGHQTNMSGPVLLRFDRRTNRFYERDDLTDLNSNYGTYPVKDLFDTQETIDFGF